MGILSKIIRPKQTREPDTVVITTAARHTDARLRPSSYLTQLLDDLCCVLEGTDHGDFDIVESTHNNNIIHLSGTDGEMLYLCIKSVMENNPICNEAHVRITKGTTAREFIVRQNETT